MKSEDVVMVILKEIVAMLAELSAPVRAMAQRQQPLNIAKSLLSSNYAIVNIFRASAIVSHLERIKTENGGGVYRSRLEPSRFRAMEKYLEQSPSIQSQMHTESMHAGGLGRRVASTDDKKSDMPFAAAWIASKDPSVHSILPTVMPFPKVALLLHNATMRSSEQKSSTDKGTKDSSSLRAPILPAAKSIDFAAAYLAPNARLFRVFEHVLATTMASKWFDEKMPLLMPSAYAPITENWMPRMVTQLRKDRLPKDDALQAELKDETGPTNVDRRRHSRPAKTATNRKSVKVPPNDKRRLEMPIHPGIQKKGLRPIEKSIESPPEKMDILSSQIELLSAQDVMKMPSILRSIVAKISSKRYPLLTSLVLPNMPITSLKKTPIDTRFLKEGASLLQNYATAGEDDRTYNVRRGSPEPWRQAKLPRIKKIPPGKTDATTSGAAIIPARLAIDTVLSSVLRLSNILGPLKLRKAASLLSPPSLHRMLFYANVLAKTSSLDKVVNANASVQSGERSRALSPVSTVRPVDEMNPLEFISLLNSSSLLVGQNAKEALAQSIRKVNLQSSISHQLSKAKYGPLVEKVNIGSYRANKRSRTRSDEPAELGTTQPKLAGVLLEDSNKTIQKKSQVDSHKNNNEPGTSNVNIGERLTVNSVARLQKTYSKYIFHHIIGKDQRGTSSILIGGQDRSMRLLSGPGRKINSKNVKDADTIMKKARDGSINLPLISQLQGILTNHVIYKTKGASTGSATALYGGQVLYSPVSPAPIVSRRNMSYQSLQRAGSTGHDKSREQSTATSAFKMQERGKQSTGHNDRPVSSTRSEKIDKSLSLRDLRKMMEQIFQEELKRYGL